MTPPIFPDAGGANPASAALNLYAGVLAASTLTAAAHRLVAELARQGKFSRVSLSRHERGSSQLLASSGLDTSQAQTELAQAILGAMDEALEQGVTLSWPAAENASVADWVTLEHQALQRHVGGAVATVPLGLEGEPFGALCVERAAGPALTLIELDVLAQQMALVVPALRWMQLGTQPWHQRAWRELRQGWSALRQPERRTTRRTLIAGAAVLLFLAVAPLEYGVGGRARIEGAQQRVLSAPTDGFVKTAHVRPGDRVKAGAALVDLLDDDQWIDRERLGSQLAQHENAYAAAMAQSDRVGASINLARISEAQAQMALIDEQLARGRLTAPFDAVVVQGDLTQSVGAAVRQGDALLTLATTDHFRVIVDIDEVDIARVQPGQTGQLVLSSLPWDGQALRVERIVPLAKAVEGRNIFEVEASLMDPPADVRPGLLGRAHVVVGRMPPLWAWTRHAMDRVRMTYWSWLG